MIKVYLKQAWMLMRQNKLFTGIYVVGTGLSIALVMTMFIIFYVKFAPIYPEYNRDRTLVMKNIKRYPKGKPDNWNCNGGVAYQVVKDMLPGLPHVEAVGGGFPNYMGDGKVTLPNKELLPVCTYYADAGFWQVFTFRFLNGKPFTKADVEASMPVAVLSEGLAKRLFATADATGRHFLYNGKDFRVMGVVEDVSYATPETAGDLWIPILHAPWIAMGLNRGLLGNTHAYILVDDAANKETVRREVQDMIRNYNLQDKEYDHDIMGQPDNYITSTFRQDVEKVPDMAEIAKSFCYILLALLFIPALNLSGMISSRMNQRLCELGVRKAYGATRMQLLNQVLCENLLLTVIGGVVGLLISYLIVLTASDWILTLFDERVIDPTKNMTLTTEMLFNPIVFSIAFGLCVVLNVISALVPAASTLRHTIIRSLNTNR